MQLDPAGLGRVNVSLQIAADGALSAALTFEKLQGEEALRGREGELREALRAAGFDVSAQSLTFHAAPRERAPDTALSFGQGGAQQGAGQGFDPSGGGEGGRSNGARAQALAGFAQADAAADLAPSSARSGLLRGLDIRV